MKKVILEKKTQAFIDELAAKGGKPLYKMTPAEAREVLETLQSSPAEEPLVKIESLVISGGPKDKVSISIYRPEESVGKIPAIVYIHGAGWVMGSADTHDHLVRELAVRTGAAAVFVNYSRSPEDRFPVAVEEGFTALKYIAQHAESLNLDSSCIAVAGDSVGGNMVIALTMLAKKWEGPQIACQLLFYPVTSSAMNTPSYAQFADGPWLTKPAMEWFWNAYLPDVQARKNPLVSPLEATIEQLHGLPPALIITAENDVLRDEGEQYASKLLEAGVSVSAARFLGTTHDFMMLNALASTPAAVGAIQLATTYLKEVFAKRSKKSAKPAKVASKPVKSRKKAA